MYMLGFSSGLFFVYFIWMPLLVVAGIIYGVWVYDLQIKTQTDWSEKEG